MNEVLQKIIDNANLGKVVTDVGPGFALSIPLLMTLSLSSGISILPADRLREIVESRKGAESEVARLKSGFCAILQNQGEACTEPPEDKAAEGWVKGRRRIAHLSVDVESYREYRRSQTKQGRSVPEDAGKRGDEQARQLEELNSQRDLTEEASARLESLRNQEADARSLEVNMVSFANNLSLIVAFSVVLGVLVSQISHLLFVDLIYERHPAIRKLREAAPVSSQQLMSKQDDELVKNYYRYTEGAVNSILPVLLTGFVFPRYAQRYAVLEAPQFLLMAAAVTVAALLLLVGFNNYKSFIKKRRALAEDVEKGQVVLVSRVV
jgi:hypothetical protein